MPTPTQFPIIFSGFATGYCYPADPETFALDLSARLSVQWNVSGVTGLLVQTATPSASQRDFGWYNPTTGRVLYYNTGLPSWAAVHPSTPSGFERRLWVGTTGDLETFDGGAAGAVGDAAGPMWEVDTDFVGRSPIGPGAVPSSSPAVNLAVGTNFGEGSHTQLVAELAAHNHTVELDGGGNDGSAKVWTAVTDNAVTLTYTSSTTGSSTPMNVIHPVRAAYIIKRSSRIYYTS